eukprot:CAMPEP_0168497156 /NCGR_PEP_ID=MMETSP0228-20121227/72624_1 /TAXON_ID=133427 /ORGANISM="Protoceratium reticulatum, Strain CCCM 535 (=CCMP 1889)" /LENGTH=51 /DNA_ID=CAMNT_0008514031 /DNA_START=13 /DNA_END=168 /DNA_ORIENTATION=-
MGPACAAPDAASSLSRLAPACGPASARAHREVTASAMARAAAVDRQAPRDR